MVAENILLIMMHTHSHTWWAWVEFSICTGQDLGIEPGLPYQESAVPMAISSSFHKVHCLQVNKKKRTERCVLLPWPLWFFSVEGVRWLTAAALLVRHGTVGSVGVSALLMNGTAPRLHLKLHRYPKVFSEIHIYRYAFTVAHELL